MTERLADVVGQVVEAVGPLAVDSPATRVFAVVSFAAGRGGPAWGADAPGASPAPGAFVASCGAPSSADLSGANPSGSSVVGSFTLGPPAAGRSVVGHFLPNPREPGAEVAARVLGPPHPLTAVPTAAARPEGDEPARAAAQAALVFGVGPSVTRMLDKRLRSCRRTGPTPHPPIAPPTPSGPTPLP